MCGIYSIYSKDNISFDSFFDALKELEYRGYDSAGLSYLNKNRFVTCKTTKKISHLEKKINHKNISSLMIGHTRWATHGKPTIKNCHPHISSNILLVHNGIVENFQELKKSKYLSKKKFITETDSEVIAHLIEHFYKVKRNLSKAVHEVGKIIKGSNAFLCIDKNNSKTLVGYKNKTPLFFGLKKNKEMIFSSDTNAMKVNLDKYYFLKNHEIIEIKDNNFKCYDSTYNSVSVEFVKYTKLFLSSKKSKLQKNSITYSEIISQKKLLPQIYKGHKSFFNKFESISKPSEIVIIGCGSSYNAAMLGKYNFELISQIPTTTYRPSEFTFFKKNSKGTLYIFLSQSGETADTCDLLEANKKFFENSLSIVNNLDSRLAKTTKYSLDLSLGIEKGVAATKTFTGQISLLYLIAKYFDNQNNSKLRILNDSNFRSFFNIENKVKLIAEKFHKSKNFFILGRNYTYPIALEAALKIKEIAYIHSEGSLSSEMKHGPIALLDDKFPILYLLSSNKNTVLKEVTNLYEAHTRSKKIILIGSASSIKIIDSKFLSQIDYIQIPNKSEEILPIYFTVLIQFLAFHLAKCNNLSIDQPRNLAKVVTVA